MPCYIGNPNPCFQIKHISENLEVTRDCGAVESMIPTSDPLAAPRSINQSPEPTKNPIPRSVIIQTDAPQDLDLVSWSVAKPLPRKMSGYVYDLTFGRDTSVYVIDNGLNNLNKVRSNHKVLCFFFDGASRIFAMLSGITATTWNGSQ